MNTRGGDVQVFDWAEPNQAEQFCQYHAIAWLCNTKSGRQVRPGLRTVDMEPYGCISIVHVAMEHSKSVTRGPKPKL